MSAAEKWGDYTSTKVDVHGDRVEVWCRHPAPIFQVVEGNARTSVKVHSLNVRALNTAQHIIDVCKMTDIGLMVQETLPKSGNRLHYLALELLCEHVDPLYCLVKAMPHGLDPEVSKVARQAFSHFQAWRAEVSRLLNKRYNIIGFSRFLLMWKPDWTDLN